MPLLTSKLILDRNQVPDLDQLLRFTGKETCYRRLENLDVFNLTFKELNQPPIFRAIVINNSVCEKDAYSLCPNYTFAPLQKSHPTPLDKIKRFTHIFSRNNEKFTSFDRVRTYILHKFLKGFKKSLTKDSKFVMQIEYHDYISTAEAYNKKLQDLSDLQKLPNTNNWECSNNLTNILIEDDITIYLKGGLIFNFNDQAKHKYISLYKDIDRVKIKDIKYIFIFKNKDKYKYEDGDKIPFLEMEYSVDRDGDTTSLDTFIQNVAREFKIFQQNLKEDEFILKIQANFLEEYNQGCAHSLSRL